MPGDPHQRRNPNDSTWVLSLIEDTVRDGNTKRVRSLLKADGQVVLDNAWDLLGSFPPSPSLYSVPSSRSMLRRISVKLALLHNILPSSIILRNVKRVDTDCRFGGSFADVYCAEQDGVPVALKRVRIFTATTEEEKEEKLKALYRETLLWKGLSHPNVVPFIGVSDVFPGAACMVLAWRPKTIRQHRSDLESTESLSTRVISEWLSQIALGLAYLHEERIVHGDLHSGNVLVDEEGRPQLTDFGMAVIIDGMSYGYNSIHGGGALRWTAPELLDPESFGLTSRRPTTASDVYSFGCLSIELYTGERPFPDLGDYQVPDHVIKGGRPLRPCLPGGELLTDGVWTLTESCWNPKPSSRPSSNSVSEGLGMLFALSKPRLDPPSSLTIKTLSPVHKVMQLPTGRGDQGVKDFSLSDNYLVVLTNSSTEVYSLRDLSHLGTIDSHNEGLAQLAMAGDTLAVFSPPSIGHRECAINIWDLPGRLRCRFAQPTDGVKVVAATRKVGDANLPAAAHVEQPTFIVYSQNLGYFPWFSQRGIGSLTLPPTPLGVRFQAPVPLMASEHYRGFACPEDALPFQTVVARGGQAFALGYDYRIWRWTIRDGSCTQVIEMRGQAHELSFDILGGLACAEIGSQLVVWDADAPSKLCTWSLNLFKGTFVDSAVMHSNHVIKRDSSGTVRIWTHDFTSSRMLVHENESIYEFHCTQRSIITVSQTQMAVWDILAGTRLQTLHLPDDLWRDVGMKTWLSCLSFKSNDRFVVARGNMDHQKLHLWMLSGGNV